MEPNPLFTRALAHMDEPFFIKFMRKEAKRRFGDLSANNLFKNPAVMITVLFIKGLPEYYDTLLQAMRDAQSTEKVTALFMVALNTRAEGCQGIPSDLQQRALAWWTQHTIPPPEAS